MNPNLGYLRTSRARAKVASWFRKLDRDKNILAGKEALDKELERHGFHLSRDELASHLKEVYTRYNATEHDDLVITSYSIHYTKLYDP